MNRFGRDFPFHAPSSISRLVAIGASHILETQSEVLGVIESITIMDPLVAATSNEGAMFDLRDFQEALRRTVDEEIVPRSNPVPAEQPPPITDEQLRSFLAIVAYFAIASKFSFRAEDFKPLMRPHAEDYLISIGMFNQDGNVPIDLPNDDDSD